MQENIHIPGSWKEVKLREGKQLMLISSQSGVTESALLSGSYSILTGKDFNELSLTEAAKVKEQILQLFNSKVDEQALTNRIEVDGEEFWLEYDLSRVCYGAKANAYDRLSKAEGNYWQIIEYIMASLFGEKVESNITIKEKKSWFNRKPKVEILNYELKPISTDFEFEQRAKKLLGMDMNSVLGSLLFFSLIGMKYLTISSSYFQAKQEQLMEQGSRDITRSSIQTMDGKN